MTLVRTALRLCMVEALSGQPAARPTIAEERFYDSRIADLAPETFKDDAKATVVLVTDEDEGEATSDQNGGPPFFRRIDVVLELGMTMAVKDGNDYVVGYPDTDSRLEASLDFLEFQILRRLAFDPAPLSVLFRSFVRIVKHQSHRQVFDDSGAKLAARLLVLTCDVNDDDEEIVNAADEPPTGYAIFPEPLRRVAMAIPEGSAGRNVCDALLAELSPLSVPSLDGMAMNFAVGDSGDPASMLDVSMEIRSAMDMPQIVATGSAVTIDYAKGTFQNLILAADVTSMAVINWPKNGKTGRLIVEITNTGDFVIAAWPTGTVWSGGGGAPVITKGAGKRDIVVLTTAMAGAPIFGNVVGQDYA